jgi:hypothetical protein
MQNYKFCWGDEKFPEPPKWQTVAKQIMDERGILQADISNFLIRKGYDGATRINISELFRGIRTENRHEWIHEINLFLGIEKERDQDGQRIDESAGACEGDVDEPERHLK